MMIRVQMCVVSVLKVTRACVCGVVLLLLVVMVMMVVGVGCGLTVHTIMQTTKSLSHTLTLHTLLPLPLHHIHNLLTTQHPSPRTKSNVTVQYITHAKSTSSFHTHAIYHVFAPHHFPQTKYRLTNTLPHIPHYNIL